MLDDGGGPITLVPDFQRVWGSYPNKHSSPAITLLVGSLHPGQTQDETFDDFRQRLEDMYEDNDFELISEERFRHRNRDAAAYRFSIVRDQTQLHVSLLWVPFGDAHVWLDAGGLPKHMRRHREVLETVLSTLTVFDDAQASDTDSSRASGSVDNDPSPQDRSVGVLFDIGQIDDACYGKFVFDEFIRVVDGKRLAGCRISVGDVMPNCEFFCVRVDTPNAKVSRHLRSVFGEQTAAGGLARLERRFMSGPPLANQPLMERGYISDDGEYVGGPWY